MLSVALHVARGRRAGFRCRVVLGWLAIVTGAVSFAPRDARAQCGASSSECRNCHEVRGARSVLAAPALWHRDHAFSDLCALCHGGDAQSRDEATAHTGLQSPLADPQATCGSCHGAESNALARRYAAAVATPRSPTPPPPPSPASAPRAVAWGNVILASLVLLVFGAGAFYIVTNERRLRGVVSGSRSAT
jgi:hypothetical protein